MPFLKMYILANIASLELDTDINEVYHAIQDDYNAAIAAGEEEQWVSLLSLYLEPWSLRKEEVL